ncbi:YjcZ family sporulation protein [Lysinibacillus fusiformis]|nr:YjcZ family sporulation protein [Lysinibacillus fusiformis]
MGYSGNVGNYNSCCGNYGMDYGKDNSSTFVLIVVLFILLIIVGATFMNKGY